MARRDGRRKACRHCRHADLSSPRPGHILTGYDHLLFTVALALAARTMNELLFIITAFTLAQATTLALAAFGLVHVPGFIVEPMISASVVVVASQNAMWPGGGTSCSRLLAACWFGLFHGLGFGGLAEALHRCRQ